MSSSLEHFTISSTLVGNSRPRDVTVYVPDACRPASGWPLLLLHDGQNLFEAERAHIPGRYWRVGEAADGLISSGRMPPILVVGVDHGGEDRLSEFTPTRGDQPDGGGSAFYGRFLLDELAPFLARAYGARTDVAGVAIGGSSLGGLATLAIARQFPGRVSRLLVMSPSVWWDDRVILHRLRRSGFQVRPRVWLDIGRREGAITVTDTRDLRDTLIYQTTALKYTEDPMGDHTEDAWARRLPAALEWLYSADGGAT